MSGAPRRPGGLFVSADSTPQDAGEAARDTLRFLLGPRADYPPVAQTRFARTARFVAAASADLTTEASLSSLGLSFRGLAADIIQPRGSGVNLTVRETGVNPAVREDGEHFCELIGQEITVQ